MYLRKDTAQNKDCSVIKIVNVDVDDVGLFRVYY